MKAQLSLEILLLIFLAIAGVGAFFMFFNRLSTTALSSAEQSIIYPELAPNLLSLDCYTDHGRAEFLTDKKLEGSVNYEVKHLNGTLVKQGTLTFNFTDYGTIYFGALMDRGRQYSVRFYTPSWSLVDACTAEVHDGAVVYLALDDGSGTTASDLSTSKNTASVNGATWTSGKRGGALYFDGVNDYLNISSPASLNFTRFTVIAWVNISGWVGSYQMFASKKYDRAWAIGVMNQSTFRYYVTGSGGTHILSSSVSPSLNTWYLVAQTYDSRSGKHIAYVNGVQNASATYTDTLASSAQPLIVGNDAAGGAYSFKGRLDELVVYNSALPPEEIAAIYQAYN